MIDATKPSRVPQFTTLAHVVTCIEGERLCLEMAREATDPRVVAYHEREAARWRGALTLEHVAGTTPDHAARST